jgi:hypothetical protein
VHVVVKASHNGKLEVEVIVWLRCTKHELASFDVLTEVGCLSPLFSHVVVGIRFVWPPLMSVLVGVLLHQQHCYRQYTVAAVMR